MQAKALQWSFWSATEIEPAIGAIFAERILKPQAERDMRHADAMLSNMLAKFPLLEMALDGRDYLLGAFTLADIKVAVQSFVIIDRFGEDLANFPNIRAWTGRCRARPARREIDALGHA
jgi:glutathione S-transferase